MFLHSPFCFINISRKGAKAQREKPARWLEFQKCYKTELENNEHVEIFVRNNNKRKQLTLLYAGKDEEHTHALILQQHLENVFKKIS